MIFSYNLLQLLKSSIDRFIASVAQLDRVSASEAECRVFESPRAHHTFLYKSETYIVLKSANTPIPPVFLSRKALKKHDLLLVVVFL